MPTKRKREIVDKNQTKLSAWVVQHNAASSDEAPCDSEIASAQSAAKDSETEVMIVDGQSQRDPPQKTNDSERGFKPKWLILHSSWLTYDEQSNKMYCKLCRDLKLKNAMGMGTDNFRTSTLTRHLEHSDHKRALNAPKERQNLEKSVNHVFSKKENAILLAMKTVYFIAKEGLPLSKYPKMVDFLKFINAPYSDALKVNEHVDYSSSTTAISLLDAISSVIDHQVTSQINESPIVTILADESTDITVRHKLCINMRIVNPTTLAPKTLFLTNIRLKDGTGKGMFEAITKELHDRKITLSKVMGLGTDGASAMTGRKEGLAGQFLRVNPHIINTHCAAHRLALCSEQAAQKIPAMQKYQKTLETIYYHFKHSSKKIDTLSAIQDVLDEPQLKYREVHQVRWLSFYEALMAIQRTLDSLITYLIEQSKHDAVANGLKKSVAQELFISLTYSMIDILEPIMTLSLTLQKKDLDIGIVQVAVEHCKKMLLEIRDGINPLNRPRMSDRLQQDLDKGNFKGHRVDKLTTPTHFDNVRKSFIDELLKNLDKRFPQKEVMTAMAVLGLRPISFLSEAELAEWGNDMIEVLTDFYGKEQIHTHKGEEFRSLPVVDSLKVKEEWQLLKQIVKALHYPRESVAALWAMIAKFHSEEFPQMMKLAALALTHPIHTADVERSFSSQNQVTTSLRNRITSENCDNLMRIMIMGEELKEFDFLPVLQYWRNVKARVIFGCTDD